MEQSTTIRRALGFTPGVVLNLLGMAEIEASAGDHAKALAFVDEAEHLLGQTDNPGLADIVQRVRDDLTSP